jgi:D-3-phosphoglycerate dehydrogenase / 2-oxoglutarate reductase
LSEFKIALTDCDHLNVDIEEGVFKEAGFVFNQLQCKTEDDVIKNCEGIQGLMNQYAPITEKVLKSLPDLKVVVRYGVGVDNVNLEAASKYGVQVCNVPDYGMHEVADQALAMMLALTRKVVLNTELVRNGIWDYKRSIPVFRHSAITVGIVGLGRIGKAFAKKVNALGCNIVACEARSVDVPDYVSLISFDELVKVSDVISIHCPADNNIDLFDKDVISKMKNTAYLINVSRGGIVNEPALNNALEKGTIAGAALDVFSKEPVNTECPLLKHKNFICSPHMAWYSEESALELKRKVAEEIIRFAKGEKVNYAINKL